MAIYQEEMSKVEAIFPHQQSVPEPEIELVDGYREMKVAGNLHYHALFAEPEESISG